MNRSDPNGASIEATLDDLYANELNVALAWDQEHGFHATLGNPPLAKKSFPTSGKAIRWLKEQALRHFPRAKFRTEGPDTAGREAILDPLPARPNPRPLSWARN